MTTKLKVWNGALIALGNERLSDTGEEIEAGRELVAAWDDVLAECVAEGSWNFAMETIKCDADTGVTPEFGFPKVFAKPSDWVRTMGVSEDEYFSQPLINSYDDSNYWSADSTPIYVRYVSNDTGLGMDLTRWPAAFTRFVELELAARVCLKLTQNDAMLERTEKRRDKARLVAKNQDAMNESQPKFRPPGSWTMARGGGGGRDRGSRGSLTG